MRLQMRVFAILVLCWSIAEAQAPSPTILTAPATSQPLLRIERLREGEAVCALVRDDGAYRLERLVRAKGDMYNGTTDADQITRLRAILADPQLRAISQDKIKAADLLTDTLDHLDLAIWRDRGWQLLSFRNPSSRKAFKDALDPLLSWFQDLQKRRPGATEVPGPATRCLPPNELQARNEIQPASQSVSDAESPAPTSSFLFRLQTSQFLGETGSVVIATVESTCTIVYPDGTYHHEKRTQATDGSRSGHSYGGRVNADSLSELNTLLDSAELKNAVSDGGESAAAKEAEWTRVWIAREKGLQHLSFMSAFNMFSDPRRVGGMNNTTYHANSGKVLDPLRHWLKEHTSKQEGATDEDKTINDCLPSR